MKNLKKLNGTEINAQQRENSERRFIRYFSQRDEKPQRFEFFMSDSMVFFI